MFLPKLQSQRQTPPKVHQPYMLTAKIYTNVRRKNLRRKASDPFWALRCSLCGAWNWCGDMVANLPQPCFVNAPSVSPLLARSAIKIVLGWRYAPTQTLTTTFIRSRKIKSLIMTWHSIREIPLHLFLDLLLQILAYFLILTKNPRWQFVKLHCICGSFQDSMIARTQYKHF